MNGNTQEQKRSISQPAVRDYLVFRNLYTDETHLKYIYDGFLYQMNEPRIRKSKTQKKIRQDFHSLGHSKDEAHKIIKILIRKAQRGRI